MEKKIGEKIIKMVKFAKKIIIINRDIIKSNIFKIKYKIGQTCFTRNRKLTFEIMIGIIFTKGMKSIQNRLNEFLDKLNINIIKKVTNSAFSQSRNNISGEAFVYLNQEGIIKQFYDKNENESGYNLWNGHRLLATDGSKLVFPDSTEIKEKYGTIEIKNQKGFLGTYTGGLFSTLYDLENKIILDSIIESGNYSERALLIRHLINLEVVKEIEEKDLVLCDRGYYSSYIFAVLIAYNKDFLFRIPKSSFKEIRELFKKDCPIDSKTIILEVNNQDSDYEEDYGLEIKKEIPKTIKVRFIRVVLDDGEIEVLATSLLDENKYSNDMFKDLYFKRWKIEVFYGLIKDKLLLENFTGKSVESVKQDIYSTIYLSNIETILTNATNAELEIKKDEKKLKNAQITNKQVSFNAIKNNVIDLFLSEKSTDAVYDGLREVFKQNPTQIRPGRSFTRKNTTPTKTINHIKRKKKYCF